MAEDDLVLDRLRKIRAELDAARERDHEILVRLSGIESGLTRLEKAGAGNREPAKDGQDGAACLEKESSSGWLGTPEDGQLFDRATQQWGVDAQRMMAVGECGEFLTLFGREPQGRLEPEAMIDEIADVTIMMAQMARIYGPEQVADRIQYKLDRMRRKLDQQRAGVAGASSSTS